jgi:hypothetical protein
VQVHAHRSYVLRCLPVRTGEGDEVTWRLSIQEAAPDAPKHAFSSLAELVTFLSADLEQARSEAHLTGGMTVDGAT